MEKEVRQEGPAPHSTPPVSETPRGCRRPRRSCSCNCSRRAPPPFPGLGRLRTRAAPPAVPRGSQRLPVSSPAAAERSDPNEHSPAAAAPPAAPLRSAEPPQPRSPAAPRPRLSGGPAPAPPLAQVSPAPPPAHPLPPGLRLWPCPSIYLFMCFESQ